MGLLKNHQIRILYRTQWAQTRKKNVIWRNNAALRLRSTFHAIFLSGGPRRGPEEELPQRLKSTFFLKKSLLQVPFEGPSSHSHCPAKLQFFPRFSSMCRKRNFFSQHNGAIPPRIQADKGMYLHLLSRVKEMSNKVFLIGHI